MNFIDLIDYAGTFAFAISGIRLASAKRFDWFGAYVVGLVTAIGGGTLRDLLLDVTHPYAAQISANAARAAELSGVPCWALRTRTICQACLASAI